MALPTNKITKIKLPNNTEYEIIPKTLRDGSTNYKVSVPTLTADDIVAVTSTTPIIYNVSNIYSIPSAILNQLKVGDLVKNAYEIYTVTYNVYPRISLCRVMDNKYLLEITYTKNGTNWTVSNNIVDFSVKFDADLEDTEDVFSKNFNSGDIFRYNYESDLYDEYVVSKVDDYNEEYWFTHVEPTIIKEFHYWNNGQGGMSYEYNEYPVGGDVEIDDLTNL